MNFSCSRDYILTYLNQIAKAVAIKPATPALSGIYLKIVDDELEIQANSYERAMSARIPVEVTEGGEVVVIGKKFLDIVRAMPDDKISFSLEPNSGYLKINSSRSNYSVATLNVGEFPKVTQNDSENIFAIESGMLKNLINKTVFACAKEENAPIYTGCLFEIKEGGISVAATNMHRLAIAKGVILGACTPMRFVVPAESLRNIAEMLPDDETPINIDYYGKNVAFKIGQIFVKARILDDTFPDYKRVIPTSNSTFINVDIVTLREAIERISIISREDPYKKMSFNFKRREAEIYAESAEIGKGVEKIAIDLDGVEISISFNYTYITDVLKVMRDGTCTISMNGPQVATAIRSNDEENFLYVVTPMRTN